MEDVIPMLKIDDARDTSLGDAFLSQLPENISAREMRSIDFLHSLSAYLITSALDSGDTNVTILDVYEEPDETFFQRNPDCALRYWDGVDFLSEEGRPSLERYNLACQSAQRLLRSQQVHGKFIDTIKNMMDIHADIYKDNPTYRQWCEYRKIYADMVAPACFYVFPDYATARDFFKSASLDYLMMMASDEGVIVNEDIKVRLPVAMRENIIRYVRCLPDVPEEEGDGSIVITSEVEEFHNLVLNGLRSISAARLV